MIFHLDIKYVIINASEVSNIDFAQVNEASADNLVYSRDKSLTFVKFEGNTPSFLDGKRQYNNNQMRSVLSTYDWDSEADDATDV